MLTDGSPAHPAKNVVLGIGVVVVLLNMVAAAIPPLPQNASEWASTVAFFIASVFGVLIAWRSHSRQADLISLFLSAFCLAPLTSDLVRAPWATILAFGVLAGSFILLILAVLPSAGAPGKLQRVVIVVAIGAVVLWFVEEVFQLRSLLGLPPASRATLPLTRVLTILAHCAPLVAGITVAVSLKGIERQRALFITLCAAPFLLTVSAANVMRLADPGANAKAIQDLANYAIFIMTAGLFLSVFKRSLIDVGVCLHRGTAFIVASVILLAVAVLMEDTLVKVIRVPGDARLASVVLALFVGMTFSYLHGFVTERVNLVFFSKRYAAERALHAFARQAQEYQAAKNLFRGMVEEVYDRAEAAFVALYVWDDGTVQYVTEAGLVQPVSAPVCSAVSVDDSAVTEMKSTRLPLDLSVHRSRPTSLTGKLAFPLSVRHRMLGFLVCGEKRNEFDEYTTPERDAVASVAESAALATLSMSSDPDLAARQVVRELREEVAALTRARVAFEGVLPPP